MISYHCHLSLKLIKAVRRRPELIVLECNIQKKPVALKNVYKASRGTFGNPAESKTTATPFSCSICIDSPCETSLRRNLSPALSVRNWEGLDGPHKRGTPHVLDEC